MKQSEALGFAKALLPSGWAEDVVISIDAGGLISSIEPGVRRESRPDVRWTEATVLPGMANVHSHAHQRLMAGLAERSGRQDTGHDTFWTWRRTMFSFVERLTPRQLEHTAAQAYVEMLEAGFTAVGEFQYLHNQPDCQPYANPAELSLRCLEAARSVGIASTMLPVLYSRGGFDGRSLEGGQRRFETTVAQVLDIAERLNAVQSEANPEQANRERLGVAPHSLRAVSMPGIERVVEAFRAIEPTGPIHMHIAEQTAEVDDCLAHCGLRPVERLLAAFEGDSAGSPASWCLIHATHLTERECAELAASGATVGLCPTTEANLGDGTFAARSFLEAGGRLGIGTDSQIRISVAEDVRQLETSQRLRDRERNVLAGGSESSTGRALFEHLAANGARALNQPMGVLAEGLRADLVVLATQHPRLVGRSEDTLLDSWLLAGDNSCVRDVYVGGELLVSSGRHRDRELVLERFRTVASELAV